MKEETTVCKALAAMVTDKGSATPSEVRFVAHAALELGLDAESNGEVQKVLGDGDNFTELVGAVETKPMRRFLFRQVVTAALVDDTIDEEEKKYIATTAKAYGYKEALVSEFVAWIRDGMKWEQRGAELLDKM